MSRYIDRYKTIDALQNSDKDPIDVLFEQPDADVRENVRGEWIKEYLVEDLGIMLYVCDKCAEPTVKKTNFCPNCGVDMRGEL